MKKPRNILDAPRTTVSANNIVRGADRSLWDDLHEAMEKNPDIEVTPDWLLWYGESFNEAVNTLHRATEELYEDYKKEKTASQPSVK